MDHNFYDLIVARLARRLRVSVATARAICELAGIGGAVRQ